MSLIVVEHHGTAAQLHALPMPRGEGEPALWLMRPTGPAVVLGSAQKPEQFDANRLRSDGVELAARRSGGGAVFINPASIVWIDVLAPHGSPLWHRELAENFVLVGRVWQQALASLGLTDTTLISARAETTPASAPEARLACWAGHGWGEILWRGTKVVGLSQRRTKWGARVQAMAVVDESPVRVSRYFANPQDRSTIEASSLDSGAYRSLAATSIDPDALCRAVVSGFRAIS